MRNHDDGNAPEGWIPLPAGTVIAQPRVVTRAALEETLAWFPLPDPSGYAGVGKSLRNKTAGPREQWMWTDESEDRIARLVRLGYRRNVVELHGNTMLAVLEHSRAEPHEHVLTAHEQDVLGRDAVLSTQIIPSAVVAESCARLWVNHGRVHDGFSLGRYGESD